MTNLKVAEHLHYLNLLYKNANVMQPEVRDALDFAVRVLTPLAQIPEV